MTELLRSTQVEDFTGRTLEGRALRFDMPSRVTDDGWKSSYYEAFSRNAPKKSISERSSFPVFVGHGKLGTTEQIGSVSFAYSDDEKALMFTAELERGDLQDALLAEIENWSDVSIGFNPLRSSNIQKQIGGTTVAIVNRTEIKVNELSMAPTGFGLAKGAEITMVRAETGLYTPRLDALQRRMRLL